MYPVSMTAPSFAPPHFAPPHFAPPHFAALGLNLLPAVPQGGVLVRMPNCPGLFNPPFPPPPLPFPLHSEQLGHSPVFHQPNLHRQPTLLNAKTQPLVPPERAREMCAETTSDKTSESSIIKEENITYGTTREKDFARLVDASARVLDDFKRKYEMLAINKIDEIINAQDLYIPSDSIG